MGPRGRQLAQDASANEVLGSGNSSLTLTIILVLVLGITVPLGLYGLFVCYQERRLKKKTSASVSPEPNSHSPALRQLESRLNPAAPHHMPKAETQGLTTADISNAQRSAPSPGPASQGTIRPIPPWEVGQAPPGLVLRSQTPENFKSLLANPRPPPSTPYQRLVLVSSRVNAPLRVYRSAQEGVAVIVYDWKNLLPHELLALAKRAVSGSKVILPTPSSKHSFLAALVNLKIRPLKISEIATYMLHVHPGGHLPRLSLLALIKYKSQTLWCLRIRILEGKPKKETPFLKPKSVYLVQQFK